MNRLSDRGQTAEAPEPALKDASRSARGVVSGTVTALTQERGRQELTSASCSPDSIDSTHEKLIHALAGGGTSAPLRLEPPPRSTSRLCSSSSVNNRSRSLKSFQRVRLSAARDDGGGPPQGTKSFAIIMDDPDAPRVRYTLVGVRHPGRCGHSECEGGQGAEQRLRPQGRRWTVPAAGHGPHRYYFTVYAVDVPALESQAAAAATSRPRSRATLWPERSSWGVTNALTGHSRSEARA